MVDAVNHGENQLGVFLAQSELFDSLTGSTAEIQQTVGDFRRNPRKYLHLKIF